MRDDKPALRKCVECNQYVLTTTCSCGGRAVSPAPPKYSPDDKYASYRRKFKEQTRKPF